MQKYYVDFDVGRFKSLLHLLNALSIYHYFQKNNSRSKKGEALFKL